jgi:hypothetical protein
VCTCYYAQLLQLAMETLISSFLHDGIMITELCTSVTSLHGNPVRGILVLLFALLRVYYVRFQVLMAVSTKIRSFWDVALCSFVGADQRFRRAYCLRHHAHMKLRSPPVRLHPLHPRRI